MKLFNKSVSLFLAAWMALTNPVTGQSYVIDWFKVEQPGEFKLRWESTPGRTYGILWSTNLINWTEMTGSTGQLLRIPASTSNRTEVQLLVPTDTARFHRVKDATFPASPADVAPPTNPTQVTSLADATSFLYTGSDPIQKGVAPGTIQAVRAAVVRGRVLNATGQPLSGVSITIKDHPQFGGTQSRADGMFDLAVNGGGLLTIEYRLPGYLPAQRQVRVPWRDFVIAPDIALITPDPLSTAIDLTNATTIQVARGSTVSDGRGVRTAIMLFPPGTQATMTLPDGSVVPLPSLKVRATEYTVGPQGPARMPGPLPPTSAYTYAVDLTVDEALAAEATRVSFSQPVPFYLDNFLGFPSGISVPTAYYDTTRSAWVPVPDGHVIKILSINGGIAEVDSSGDGLADNGATIGMTTAERETLALTYAAGKSLWRVSIGHFTSYDMNFPTVGPGDAVTPNNPKPPTKIPEGGCGPADANSVAGSSVIDCQQQRLRETINIVGTTFSLNYASDRVPGYMAKRSFTIPVSGTTIPASLTEIRLRIEVAGQVFSQIFSPQTNLSYSFTWNGKNGLGQDIFGDVKASVEIGYVYDSYYALPADLAASFGETSGVPIPGNLPPGPDLVLSQEYSFPVGRPPQDISGWSLSDHHIYDPNGEVLFLGNGRQRRTQSLQSVITTAAGNRTPVGPGGNGFEGDGGPATAANLNLPQSVAVGADGSLFIADTFHARIRRVTPDGIITTVAGGGGGGDGGLATAAALDDPRSVAVGADGSLYIADSMRIRRVRPDGIIHTVAGNGTQGFEGDGGPATAAALDGPLGLAIGPDGSLFIADTGNMRIRRVRPDGIIQTVAGNGSNDFSGDGGPATAAALSLPFGIALGVEGRLYIADWGSSRIRRVTPDGIITTVAGNGSASFSGDGGPATAAGVSSPKSVVVGSDGSLFIADRFRIRQVTPDGIINTVSGKESPFLSSGEGGPAAAAYLDNPTGVAVGADSALFFADIDYVYRVAPAWPGFQQSNTVIPSEDGAEVYVFDSTGRHLRSINSLTGADRHTFSYDPAGLLIAITNGDGGTTLIERDGSGKPLTIVSPEGLRTFLALNPEGFLQSVVNPAGEQNQMSYSPGGLLTSFVKPGGQASQYTFDPEGRLLSAVSADGHMQIVARTNQFDGYQVNRTTALGKSVSYSVDNLSTGVERRTTTFPDGTATQVTVHPDGRTTTKYPDGSVAVQTDAPDPRFGMLAPVPQNIITTNGSLVATQQMTRSIDLSSPDNPLSLISLTETLRRNGRESIREFTAATRTFVDRSPAGRTRETEIDTQGRPVRVSVPGITEIQSAYDARGRLTNVTQGDRITRFTYDSNGFLSSIADPVGRTVKFTNDAAGRVLSQTRPDGQLIRFAYETNGNLKSLTPPGRPAHTFDYTAGDLEAAYRAPDLGDGLNVTSNQFNLDRQFERTILPGGGTIDPSYDAAGRIASLAIGRGTYGYRYEATNGLLKSITAPDGGGLTNLYQGSLLAGQVWSGQVAGSVTQTHNRDYEVVSRSVNGGHTISNAYDNDGLLVKAGDMTFTRNPQNGALTGTALGVVTDSYQYNEFGEVTNYVARVSGNPILSISYVRDRLGRITEKAETESGVTTVFGYSYDLAGQLIEARRNGAVTSAYTYDSNGNRLSRTGPGINETGTYDAQDRLLTYGNASYSYTPDGRLHTKTEAGQTTTYTYDELGNLTRVDLPNGDVIEYLIDGENRRVGRKLNGVLERAWLYESQLRPAAELDGNGNLVSRFVYGARVNVPEFMIRDGVRYRILLDHLGSPRLVVNETTGSMAQRLECDEFGNVSSDSNPGFQPFGFSGGFWDSEVGLVRFGERDYSPTNGRWTLKEPLRFVSGDTSFYLYAQNDPINLRDVNGQGIFSTIFEWIAPSVLASAIETYLPGDPMFRRVASEIIAGAVIGGAIGFAAGVTFPLSIPAGVAAIGPGAFWGLAGGGLSQVFLEALGYPEPFKQFIIDPLKSEVARSAFAPMCSATGGPFQYDGLP